MLPHNSRNRSISTDDATGSGSAAAARMKRIGMSTKSIIAVSRKASNLGIVDDERKSTVEIDDKILFALRNAVHEERAKEKSEKSQNLLAKIVLVMLATLILSVAATTVAIYYVVQQSKEVVVLPNGLLSSAHPAADGSIDVAAMDDRPGAESIGNKGAVVIAKPEALFSPRNPPNFFDGNDGNWYVSSYQDDLLDDEDGPTRHRRRLDVSSVCGNSDAMMEQAQGSIIADHIRHCTEGGGSCSLCGTCILGEGFANIELMAWSFHTFEGMEATFQMDDAFANGYVSGQYRLGEDHAGFLLYCNDGNCYELTDMCSSWFCDQTGHQLLSCGPDGARRSSGNSVCVNDGCGRKLETADGTTSSLRKMAKMRFLAKCVD